MSTRKGKKADHNSEAAKNAQLKELTEKFRQLGIEKPEAWAAVQVNEGIPLLPKFYFLKYLWHGIVKEEDTQWIDRDIAIAEKNLDAPFIGGALALKSLRAKGATDEELTDVVRNYQMEYMWYFISLLEQGVRPVHDYEPPLEEQFAWVLIEIDDEFRCLSTLDGLQELAMVLDPTGRSCRTRGWVNAPLPLIPH
ncbi:MAG TPA: hypothetical protein PK156_26975 [Polyangium sp.]|nr:hypothetical protein [Polyangium sp.]